MFRMRLPAELWYHHIMGWLPKGYDVRLVAAVPELPHPPASLRSKKEAFYKAIDRQDLPCLQYVHRRYGPVPVKLGVYLTCNLPCFLWLCENNYLTAHSLGRKIMNFTEDSLDWLLQHPDVQFTPEQVNILLRWAARAKKLDLLDHLHTRCGLKKSDYTIPLGIGIFLCPLMIAVRSEDGAVFNWMASHVSLERDDFFPKCNGYVLDEDIEWSNMVGWGPGPSMSFLTWFESRFGLTESFKTILKQSALVKGNEEILQWLEHLIQCRL